MVQHSLTACHVLSTQHGASITVQAHLVLHCAENLMKTQVSGDGNDCYIVWKIIRLSFHNDMASRAGKRWHRKVI